MRGPVGEARATADGTFDDAFPEAAIAAVKCRWPTTCPEDALAAIGFERLMSQFPVELVSAFRTRLQQAWSLWPLAGTKVGIITALNLLGFPNVQVFENNDWTVDPSPGFEATAAVAITGASNAGPIVVTAPGHGLTIGRPVTIVGVLGNTAANGTWDATVIDANTISIPAVGNGAYTSSGTLTPIPEWWRFWIVINPPHGFAALWRVGDGTLVGDGHSLGLIAPPNYPALMPTINAWKPAHAKLVNTVALLSGSIVGGGWLVGDGTLVGGSVAFV